MMTGPTADDESAVLDRLSSPRALGRQLLVGLVHAPGRSAAIAFVVIPYLWLLWYVVSTAFGIGRDPIVAGDWLTLVFTTYALLSALALAHRILTVGVGDLTQEYLVDIVALTWLTGFYFVWMIARESVAESTTFEGLYGPVIDGQPEAQVGAVVVVVSALVTVGLIYRSSGETQLFRSEFRTALVTLPAVVTATVLLGPGPDSLVWPLVGGVFVGTGAGGLFYVEQVASWTAKGAFAVCSLVMWSLGALGWVIAYRTRPPNDEIVLDHVRFDRSTNPGTSDEPNSASGPTDDDD